MKNLVKIPRNYSVRFCWQEKHNSNESIEITQEINSITKALMELKGNISTHQAYVIAINAERTGNFFHYKNKSISHVNIGDRISYDGKILKISKDLPNSSSKKIKTIAPQKHILRNSPSRGASPKNNKNTPPSINKREELIASDSPATKALKDIISFREGNYESYNRGKAGVSGRKLETPLTQMTIGEIRASQSRRGGLRAVGKYQLIPSTLAAGVKHIGASLDSVFSPLIQEKLFSYLIYKKRPKLGDYLTGKNDNLFAAHHNLAYEFASIPAPNGRGKYDNDDAGNLAYGGKRRAGEVSRILQALRQENMT